MSTILFTTGMKPLITMRRSFRVIIVLYLLIILIKAFDHVDLAIVIRKLYDPNMSQVGYWLDSFIPF